MANWKKVIVSGSDAELNEVSTSSHITSSGIISASGKLYGNLDENSDQTYVVVYNPTTGELEYKLLNLVNAQRAPELFMIDIDDTDKETDVNFRLSFDSGSPTIPTNAPYKFSASLDGGSTFSVTSSVYDVNNYLNINSSWFTDDVDDIEYYNPNTDGLGSSKTASYSEGNTPGPKDVMSGILYGANRQDIILHLQSHGTSTDYTAVPAYTPGPAYVNRAFEAPIHGDTGSIQVYLNNTEAPVAEFSLTGSGNPAITTEVADIIPNISPSGSALDTLGATDTTKTFRSGSITIEAEAQRDGYNFAYIFYTGSRGDTQIRALTNFTHWFYDQDGAGQALSNVGEDTVSSLAFSNVNQTSSISGIRFWDQGAGDTLTHRASISNFYRNIYPTANSIQYSDISTNTISDLNVTKGGSHVNEATQNKVADSVNEYYSLPSLQDIDNAHTSTLNVTSSVVVSMPDNVFHQPTDFLDIAGNALNTTADINFKVNFLHINGHKDPYFKTGGEKNFNDYMVNSFNNNSTEDDFESFRTENFRIQNKSYSTSDDPGDGSHAWDGKRSLANGESNGYGTSAVQYYSHLIYPTKCGDGGVFDPVYGPTNNQPNYSSVTGERVYLRYFEVTQAQAGSNNLNFEFIGSGKIVGSSYAGGGTDHIFMELWRNAGGGSSAMNGTFTDVYTATLWNNSNNTITDYDTQFVELASNAGDISYNQDNPNGGVSLRKGVIKIGDNNGNAFSAGEEIIIKLKLPQGFTGYISAMALQHGNSVTSPLLGTSGYTAL